MRKTDKKIEKQLISVLTAVCEHALEQVEGFKWLTHTVNYANFPKSLRVIVIFDRNAHLQQYMASNKQFLSTLVASKLNAINVDVRKVKNLLSFDTEERCENEHAGNWSKRLGKVEH